jgi:hypothetical protein
MTAGIVSIPLLRLISDAMIRVRVAMALNLKSAVRRGLAKLFTEDICPKYVYTWIGLLSQHKTAILMTLSVKMPAPKLTHAITRHADHYLYHRHHR